MFENNNFTPIEENKESGFGDSLELLDDFELEDKVRTFLSNEILSLSQEEIQNQLKLLLIELSKRGMDGFSVFSFSLPDEVTAEEIQSGQSSWAKVYKSLFSISKTAEYKESPELQMMVHELENIIDQNPQMLGPVAMWDIAKDIMWQRDIPSHAKNSLMGSMTYALAFFDTNRYEAELLKNLDFENPENYTEVAHMLEALKQFWSHGHESYAEDRVPDFYLNVLRKIKESPESNYLLSVRAQEILSILEQSEDFPVEKVDIEPFELSKGTYASTQVGEGLTVVPEDVHKEVAKAIEEFGSNEEKITPPQWMLDEAVARGESVIYWEPPQDLIQNRERLFDEMHSYAVVPIEEIIRGFLNATSEEEENLIFDYEYLVSRPIREMIQDKFHFELKNLSIKEQFYFLNYLKRITVAEAETMQHFTRLYGVDGMRTFLALERGDESLGDAIVAFGQHEEVAKEVFRYYSELLDSAEKAEILVRERTHCKGESCTEQAEQIRDNLLGRAQKDLEEAVNANDPDVILDQIEKYDIKAKEYVALLQEVGERIEEVSGVHLSQDDKTQMRILLRSNYSRAYPNKDDAEFKKAVAASLESSFDNKNTVFNILRDGRKIISFNRFDVIQDDSGHEVIYFGSFNAAFQYSGVGGVMLEETITEQLKSGNPMMAHCDPTQPITRKYIEDGFVATDFYTLAGKPSFEIWRTKTSDAYLESKNKSINELVSLTKHKDILVREQEIGETYPELNEGKALTRYFEYQGKTYLVFETLPSSLQTEFTAPQTENAQKAA